MIRIPNRLDAHIVADPHAFDRAGQKNIVSEAITSHRLQFATTPPRRQMSPGERLGAQLSAQCTGTLRSCRDIPCVFRVTAGLQGYGAFMPRIQDADRMDNLPPAARGLAQIALFHQSETGAATNTTLDCFFVVFSGVVGRTWQKSTVRRGEKMLSSLIKTDWVHGYGLRFGERSMRCSVNAG